ncbi:MAG: hypothetical protein ACYC6W_09685 [Nitrosotalea sp.]
MSDGFKMVDDRPIEKKEAERVLMKDIVVIGNAEPDELSDGRKSVCTVGYHKDYGLIRIYPVPPNAPMRRWNKVTIPLERNPQDNRQESWKIQGSKDKQLSDKIILTGKIEQREEQMALLNDLKSKYGFGCIDEINDKRLSLGFIKPTDCSTRFIERGEHDTTIQKDLFTNEPFLTIKNFQVQPRMTYRCSNCKTKEPHDQQILEWGVYEGIRKKPQIKEQILKGLHVDDPEYDIDLLVGNQNRYRRSFMVISVYRFKK